jgi:hypothetical protein
MPAEVVNKEKEYLTPDRYTFFNPRKKTNSFDLDLIWNEKSSYIDEKLRCLAALVDKPNTYILSVVYQDPFALNVFDIDIGLGGKYTSVTELLLQKSQLEFKPTRVANEISTRSYLIPAIDLQKATSMKDYILPSGKDNISACVFGTLDEILDLCDVASTDEPAVVGFAAAPIEEVLRILELYITNEGKFSQFLSYKTVPKVRKLRLQPMSLKGDNEMDLDTNLMKEKKPVKFGKPRLTPVESDDIVYEDFGQKMTTEMSSDMDDDVDFVKEFDDYVKAPASITFPFSPRC